MSRDELEKVLELHKKWLNNEPEGVKANLRGADLRGADLSYADLSDADLDFSCLPLWCGSLTANMDDKQVKQLLYHVLSIVKHSNNVSEILKSQLLTEQNLTVAKEFHRADECKKL